MPRRRTRLFLVQREAVAQAVYQAPVHHKVHTAVAAHLLGQLAYFADDLGRVFIV